MADLSQDLATLFELPPMTQAAELGAAAPNEELACELLPNDDESDTDLEDGASAADEAGAVALLALPLPMLPVENPSKSVPTHVLDNGLAGGKNDAVAMATAAGGSSVSPELTPSSQSSMANDAQRSADVSTQDARALVEAFVIDPAAATDAPVETSSSSQPLSTTQAAQLHAMNSTQSSADSAQVPTRDLRAPVGTPAWRQELGDQISWMAQRGQEAASLRLSPEHLGPVEVRISISEGQTSVWFGAANADTRSALDQALPRLREMFAAQGMSLADAGVFKEAPRQHYKPSSSAGTHEAGNVPETAQVKHIAASRLRLVDTYV